MKETKLQIEVRRSIELLLVELEGGMQLSDPDLYTKITNHVVFQLNAFKLKTKKENV